MSDVSAVTSGGLEFGAFLSLEEEKEEGSLAPSSQVQVGTSVERLKEEEKLHIVSAPHLRRLFREQELPILIQKCYSAKEKFPLLKELFELKLDLFKERGKSLDNLLKKIQVGKELEEEEKEILPLFQTMRLSAPSPNSLIVEGKDALFCSGLLRWFGERELPILIQKCYSAKEKFPLLKELFELKLDLFKERRKSLDNLLGKIQVGKELEEEEKEILSLFQTMRLSAPSPSSLIVEGRDTLFYSGLLRWTRIQEIESTLKNSSRRYYGVDKYSLIQELFELKLALFLDRGGSLENLLKRGREKLNDETIDLQKGEELISLYKELLTTTDSYLKLYIFEQAVKCPFLGEELLLREIAKRGANLSYVQIKEISARDNNVRIGKAILSHFNEKNLSLIIQILPLLLPKFTYKDFEEWTHHTLSDPLNACKLYCQAAGIYKGEDKQRCIAKAEEIVEQNLWSYWFSPNRQEIMTQREEALKLIKNAKKE